LLTARRASADVEFGGHSQRVERRLGGCMPESRSHLQCVTLLEKNRL